MKISEILTKYDTDKNSNKRRGHCYGRAYDHLFSKFDRDSGLHIIEVGTYYGESLLAWREFFPQAIITGLDIKDLVETKDDSIDYEICDVKEYKPKQEYDIVIDDGSHALSDILFTVQDFKIKEGGIMVIEDARNPGRWAGEIAKHTNYSVELIDLRRVNGQFDDALIVLRNYGYNK